MSIPIAESDVSKLEEEIKRITAIAKGETSGIISSRYTKEDEDTLQEAISTMEEKYGDGLRSLPWISGVIYAIAQVRDAKYTCMGRKFMRTMSLNTRAKIVYNRALIFGSAEAND